VWLVDTYGHTTLSRDEYMPCVGREGTVNMDYLANLKKLDGDREEMRLLRRKKFEELRDKSIPVIQENVLLAREFKASFPALRHALVSSSSSSDIQRGLTTAGLADFFETRVSYEDTPTMRRKPAPDQYLSALERMQLKAEVCVAFEDTASGVTSATDAGIRTIALPNTLTVHHNFAAATLILKPGEPKSATAIMARLSA
jgi:HAD superfamily hydrolase (TIGR01509 family)